jgi:hypothetical protein
MPGHRQFSRQGYTTFRAIQGATGGGIIDTNT